MMLINEKSLWNMKPDLRNNKEKMLKDLQLKFHLHNYKTIKYLEIDMVTNKKNRK